MSVRQWTASTSFGTSPFAEGQSVRDSPYWELDICQGFRILSILSTYLQGHTFQLSIYVLYIRSFLPRGYVHNHTPAWASRWSLR